MRLLLILLIPLLGCRGPAPASSLYNPLGWPAKGVGGLGTLAAASGLPLVRDCGRLLQGSGELLEAPAMLVEGLVTFAPEQLLGSGVNLVRGTGSVVVSASAAPFFFVTGANVDLARDAERVNAALAYLDTLDVATVVDADDPRRQVFPPGTRVEPWAGHLLWTLPDGSRILQVAEMSPWFSFWLWATGQSTDRAQERLWGFVVGDAEAWEARSARHRTVAILHEMYHQQFQLRDRFLGWTTAYWPAYGISYARHGWYGTWAETGPGIGAGIVDGALRSWRMPRLEDPP